MLVPVNDTKTMDTYLNGVMRRADHHGGNVLAVIPALRGYVEMFGTGINAFSQSGDLKNTAWFVSKKTGFRYFIGYCHHREVVSLRRANRQGVEIATLSNDTPLNDFLTLFQGL